MEDDSRKIVDAAVKCAHEKKGFDVTIMDMKEVTHLCDYFVIVSAMSRPQAKAIAEHIEVTLKEELGLSEKKIQGKLDGSWVLIDYGTVVIHVFLENLRQFYDLEGLWNRARQERPQPLPAKAI
jgi:ribosome-associated protein